MATKHKYASLHICILYGYISLISISANLMTNITNTFIIRCALILLAPISILKEFKISLLSTTKKEDIISYCSTRQYVNIQLVCKNMLSMLGSTPAKNLSGKIQKGRDGNRIEDVIVVVERCR